MLREVQLKPAFADTYPALAPGRWYTAAAVAGLIKGERIVREGGKTRFTDRILKASHFEFRGGGPRRGSWVGLRTRYLDRHPVPRPALTVSASRSAASWPALLRSPVLAGATPEWSPQGGRYDRAAATVGVGGHNA